MQTIDITDFWIDRPSTSGTNNFTILSDRWCSLNDCTIGNGKAYYYNGLVDKQQLKCIVIEDTFYFDFSANSISDVIKQQMWILKHTKNIDYKIEFVCLWEMFNLPTIEELNEFAKIKQEVVVPEQSTVDQYNHSIEEMRLSTGLPEEWYIRQIALPLSEYIDLMLHMTHTRLNTNGVIHYATIIHNYHNPVVQSQVQSSGDLYNDSLQILMEVSGMPESMILPEEGEELETYINSINRLMDEDQDIDYEDVTRHATNVYNYHRITHPLNLTEEVIDHPF